MIAFGEKHRGFITCRRIRISRMMSLNTTLKYAEECWIRPSGMPEAKCLKILPNIKQSRQENFLTHNTKASPNTKPSTVSGYGIPIRKANVGATSMVLMGDLLLYPFLTSGPDMRNTALTEHPL